jgi:hypothetical protein
VVRGFRNASIALACIMTVTAMVLVPTSSADPPDLDDLDSLTNTGPHPDQILPTPRPTNSRPQPAPDDILIKPLPVFVPSADSPFSPQYPFPFDQIQYQVTPADINAEREMCQWYNAQYNTLLDQINRLQFNRIQQNGPGVRIGSGTDWDYSYNDVQQQADIVTANIDQTVAFLEPRARALTQLQNYVGDNYFPLYQGQEFYLMWQHLYNTGNGIKAHQPDWFTGPSFLGFQRAGSHINRSHVCR